MSEEMNTSNVTSEYLDKMAEALISEELERSVLGISELMCLIQYCKEEEQAMMDRSQNGRSAVGYTDRKINEYLSRYFYKRRMFGEYLPEKERDIFHQSENVLISEPGSASRCSTSSEDTRRPVSPAVSSGTSSSLEESTSVTESSDSETPVKKPFLKKLKNALKKLSLQEKSKDSLSVPESTSTESSTSLKTYFPPEEAGEESGHIKEEVNEAAAAAAGEQAADMPLDENAAEKKGEDSSKSENVLISEPGSASRCSTSSEDTRRSASPAVSSGTSSRLEENTSVTESSDSETPVKKPFLKKLKNALKKLSLQEKSKDSLSVPESTSTESSTSLKTYFPPEEAGEESGRIKEEVNEAAATAAGEQAADMPLDDEVAEYTAPSQERKYAISQHSFLREFQICPILMRFLQNLTEEQLRELTTEVSEPELTEMFRSMCVDVVKLTTDYIVQKQSSPTSDTFDPNSPRP